MKLVPNSRVSKKGEWEAKRDFYKTYMRSPEWHVKRQEFLKRFHNTCFVCQKKYAQKFLQVHHKHYKTLGDETDKDVMVLCYKHHKGLHDRLKCVKCEIVIVNDKEALVVRKMIYCRQCLDRKKRGKTRTLAEINQSISDLFNIKTLEANK